MSVHDIWNAVLEGNAEVLRAVLDARKNNTILRSRADNHGWTLLHFAAVSRSLECVQLIATRLGTGCEMRCHEGFTPLARACKRSAPLTIVLYLIKRGKSSINIGDNEDVTPLHYAVQVDRLDLVETLVAKGANANALDYADESPADTAAFDTGNISILIYLLFMAKSRCPDLAVFSARARYDVTKKIAIFKILYNLTYPQHMHRQRYDVSDILRPALLSSRSQSLIPFFIETEMKWEKNDIIRSLFERLSKPGYDILAMLVWCEATHPLALAESLVTDFQTETGFETVNVLAKLIHAAIVDDDKLLELLENFISFLKISKPFVVQILPNIFIKSIHDIHGLWYRNLPARDVNTKIRPRFQHVVDLLMPYFEDDVDEFVNARIREIPSTEIRCLKSILPFISYCPYLFMCPTIYDSYRSDLMKILCRSIGSIEVQKVFCPISPCFPLKRIARDVVRMAVYKAIGESKKRHIAFIQRLESFELPKELTLYLKYSDSATVYGLLEDCDL